jgi:hypothetical protein
MFQTVKQPANDNGEITFKMLQIDDTEYRKKMSLFEASDSAVVFWGK